MWEAGTRREHRGQSGGGGGRGVFIVFLQEGTGEAQDGSVRIISVESGA